jgi:hypothetical protein
VSTTCAPGNQEKSSDSQSEQSPQGAMDPEVVLDEIGLVKTVQLPVTAKLISLVGRGLAVVSSLDQELLRAKNAGVGRRVALPATPSHYSVRILRVFRASSFP